MKVVFALVALFSMPLAISAGPIDGDSLLSPRDIQRRDDCVGACSDCSYCSSQGCLSNCQLGCWACCSINDNDCEKCSANC
ncbi:hypothetical protein FQN54_009442 [Arachnomyces sp. PD_36]|nr:hypothetical protein FQN54_009442 [Arachnomyces sp. PD_36]